MDVSQLVYALGRRAPEGIILLGTCFAVASGKVATAFHVVGADTRNVVLLLPKMKTLSDYQDTADSDVSMMPLVLAAADPIRDLAILEVPEGSSLPYFTTLPGADAVAVGSQVVTLGFPHANVGRFVLTQQWAHIGARILIDNAGQRSKHVVLNTQAREGQSGGPVIDAATGAVVAVVVGSFAPGGGGGISLGGVDPWTLHQTTHGVSSEYIGPML